MESLWTRSSDAPLHRAAPWLVEGLDWAATAVDLASILLLLLGALRFVLGLLQAEIGGDLARRRRETDRRRIELGRYILSGLELLIVSDIIHTALSLELADLVFLGVLVVIRTVISLVLDRELAGLQRELDGPEGAAAPEAARSGGAEEGGRR